MEKKEKVEKGKHKTATGLDENIEAFLCYVGGWITGIVFLILEKDNKTVKFHAMQSIVVFGSLNVLAIFFGFIPLIGILINMLIAVLGLILWIMLMVKSYQGEMYKVPVAAEISENLLNKH